MSYEIMLLKQATHDLLTKAIWHLGDRRPDHDEWAREVICHLANKLQAGKRNKTSDWTLTEKEVKDYTDWFAEL